MNTQKGQTSLIALQRLFRFHYNFHNQRKSFSVKPKPTQIHLLDPKKGEANDHHVCQFVSRRFLHYVQGQYVGSKIREYFYFIDHQGQLFLDDARIKNFTSCFKEKDFLVFFFKRLKDNAGGKYGDEFPFLSPCGREKNYVRCDDTPVVFTHVIEEEGELPERLAYNGAGDRLTVPFEPEHVCMLPHTGCVYHPAPQQYGSIGLIKSSLAIEFSKYFEFESGDESEPPSHFTWDGTRHTLSNVLFDMVKDRPVTEE